MPVSRRGFSLIEVVVAAAVLSLTCTVVTAAVSVSLRAQRRAAARESLVSIAEAEVAQLRRLPFYVGRSPGPSGDPAAPSAVAEVFPHADVTRNRADARYCPPGDGSVGDVFVTDTIVAGARVRLVARFVVVGDTSWEPVDHELLQEWAAGDAPPSGALDVRVSVAESGALQGLAVSRHAVLVAEPPVVATPTTEAG